MKKLIKILIVLILLVVIIGGVAIFTQMNRLVKAGVETLGPKVLQAPVTLADVDLSIFSGEGTIRGLEIGNPEGFQTENAFVLNSLRIKLDPASLKTSTIRINEILIEGPQITIEGLKGGNLKKLQENAEEFSGKPKGEDQAVQSEDPSSKPGKQVIIDNFVVKGGKLDYSPALGKSIPIALPDIHLTGIGEASGGATMGQVLAQVIGQIDDASLGAIAGASKLIGDAALKGAEEYVGEIANSGLDAVTGIAALGTNTLSNVADQGTKLLKKLSLPGGTKEKGAATSGTSHADELIEATGSATESIQKGADRALGGLKGFLGGAIQDKAPTDTESE